MSDTLSKLAQPAGATFTKTRIGRGVGSGLGKTAGRGQKGQYARVRGFKPHFEGGQTPIQRRLPKRGFINPFASTTAEVNVGDLEVFAEGAEVNATTLKAARLVRGRYDLLKVLGSGALTKKLVVHAHRFSKGAVAKIEKAGGKVVVIAPPAAKGKAPGASSEA